MESPGRELAARTPLTLRETMSAAKKSAAASVETLRRQLATAEAKVEVLRAKIARMDAKVAGSPMPVTGLDLLWKAALPLARTRSSKVQCRAEWNRIPNAERPTVAVAVAALQVWNRCSEWKKDSNQFVPGLHRFIKNRMWEDLPTAPDPMARYRQPTPKPQSSRPTEDDEIITDPAEIARLLSITPNAGVLPP